MDHSPRRHRQFRGAHREHRWNVLPLRRRSRRRASWRELLLVLLAGALIGLGASGTWPGGESGSAGGVAVARAVRDPRAVSREQQRVLASQESAPPNAFEAPAGGGGAGTGETLRFGVCHSGGGTNCVVDGDTFWMHGEKIRVADIDAPETHPPRCAEEKRLGEAATARLQALLNAGPVTLAIEGRATDRYGRKLRVVTRDGESLGAVLVAEGLARRWGGRRMPWC